MTLILSLVAYGGCLLVILLVWSTASRRVLVMTPFLVFCIFEILWSWPATIYGQFSGLVDGYPAFLMALAFLAFLAGFLARIKTSAGHRNLVGNFRNARVCLYGSESRYIAMTFLSLGVLVALILYLYRGLPPTFGALVDLYSGNNSVLASQAHS